MLSGICLFRIGNIFSGCQRPCAECGLIASMHSLKSTFFCIFQNSGFFLKIHKFRTIWTCSSRVITQLYIKCHIRFHILSSFVWICISSICVLHTHTHTHGETLHALLLQKPKPYTTQSITYIRFASSSKRGENVEKMNRECFTTKPIIVVRYSCSCLFVRFPTYTDCVYMFNE